MPTRVLKTWLASSLERIYPASAPRARARLALDAARGERVSFQVAVRNGALALKTVALELLASGGIATRVRRVGYVPVAHLNPDTPLAELEGAASIPGLVPDPLFDETQVMLGGHETHAFWCTLTVPAEATAGTHRIVARLSLAGGAAEPLGQLEVTVTVHALTLEPRRDFPIMQWFYADALCDHYRVEPFTETFWGILRPYLRNLVEHFQDTVYTPVFTPPLDGVKRPTQLLGVRRQEDRYRFDWSMVKRWVDLAREVGITRFEWTHLFTQWGARHAIRIYEGGGVAGTGELLWDPETAATSPTYRAFLAQFLPEFASFLDRERLLGASFFHISDEPSGDHVGPYRQARGLIRELAPWMTTIDALSHVEYAREGLVDLPVAVIDRYQEFVDAGVACGAYFCCQPRGAFLNRFMDTPLAKIRMSGWLFFRFQPRLFLHWGYNFWHTRDSRRLIDPFATSDAGNWPNWSYGDPFCVYPGEHGPIDSIRWEVFAESMQDFALLQTVGADPAGRPLAALRGFGDFPKQATWIVSARRRLLTAAVAGGATGLARSKRRTKPAARRGARKMPSGR